MKKKVALFANGWNGESLDNFINGFNEHFTEDEVDLFVFTSHAAYSQSLVMRDAEDSIYLLPDYSFFDAVIVFCSGLNSEHALERILKKCRAADVPVILQGYDVEGITSVTADNYVGMKGLCDHLIEEHNVRDVVYLAGPEDNEDSNYRKSVLKESLEEHGFAFDDNNVVYANWEVSLIHSFIEETYSGHNEKLPDAIVCANDQMAIFALTFLEQIGVKVPEDVIVTGFDNLGVGRVYYPSLSTVDQSYQEQGNVCAQIVEEMQENPQLVKKRVIPCTVSPGESCGCLNCKDETGLRQKLGCSFWSNQYVVDNTQGRESLLDMCIMSYETFEEMQSKLEEEFFSSTGAETKDFHIYVNPQYKKLEYMDLPEREFKGAYYSSVMDVVGAKTNGVICDEKSIKTKKLFWGYKEEGDGKTYIFKALKIDSSVAGYMVMGYTKGAFENRKYIEFSGRLDKTLKKFQKNIVEYNRTIKIQEQANEFLRQTVEALASAVDAKDAYTHGHSARVANYSKKIAKLSGMSEEECADAYLAGLLHDVGKIGIKDDIINKKGKLTDEEIAVIKQHPVLGEEILAKILMSPSLSVGAKHHHERYDGKGYPDNLKGEDIPKIARIIAVADAYDAMTSTRSYRDLIPQMYVREELVKGIGTQFDPEFAKIMIHLLDKDENYLMKEKRSEEVFGPNLTCEFIEYMTKVTAGIRITDRPISINIQYEPLKDGGMPVILLYDSADTRYYLDDNSLSEEMDFIEYASIGLDGDISTDFVRKMKLDVSDATEEKDPSDKMCKAEIQLVKQQDHLLMKVITEEKEYEMVFALYDASRYMYLALTGEYCKLAILDVNVDDQPVDDGYVPRIAEKISYIDKEPEGTVPNIQIDGWQTSVSEPIEFEKSLDVTFRTMSLPSSRRVWHCPIICLFTADDGQINGSNYKEIASIRLDGESWCDNTEVINHFSSSQDDSFENWSIWKQNNKAGVDCTLSLLHEDNVVNLQVENSGLITVNQTILPESIKKVYCCITGDQCAITNIRIHKE